MQSISKVAEKGNFTENWSEIISPKAHLFDIRLKEVWHYRYLILLFVKRDMASQFRQTILGPLWHIIQPAFTTIMYLIVFTKIAKISTDHLPPVLFYMSGIAIWNYFASCLNNTSATFVNNAGIFGKVYFPRLVLPLSSVLSNMVRFAIQFGLVLAVALYYAFTNQYTIHAGWHILFIPVIVIIMAAMGLSLGILISSLTTKYRDLSILTSFGVQLLMYVTPVVYPLSFLTQSKYKSFIEWNPLSPLVEGFRYSLFGEGSFNMFFFDYSIAFTIVVFFIAITIFSKVERTFMDTV
jgi:lipopolysaccharide transport system permease protein